MDKKWYFGDNRQTDYLIDSTGDTGRLHSADSVKTRILRGIIRATNHESKVLSVSPIDREIGTITSFDFLTEIENNPVLSELIKKYGQNWQKILSNKTRIDAMLLHIQNSLISDRDNRKGFDPGYIKILLFIQDKYLAYKENAPR